MIRSKTYILFLITTLILGCSKDTPIDENNDIPIETNGLYFPPLNGTDWDTVDLEDLNWNADAEAELYDFLNTNGTRAFIVLKDGKIALEEYFGDHTENTPWYWASAGKTLTSFTTGIALQEGFLSLNDKTADYLGTGWTSLTNEKEELITIWHQLTMTSGMDDTQGDCKTPNCLTYVADAGTRWSYHNAPYTLIQQVISNATQMEFEDYFASKVKDRIGMGGSWISTNGINNVYWSTARSMARFGLLNLNKGNWNGTPILENTDYITSMSTTSQDLNKSYGYLWWLNGKESAMVPQSQLVFNTELMPNAPDDLYAGLGKNDQKLYIVPNQNLVVVRMGEDTGYQALGPSGFDDELWALLNKVMN